MFEMIYNHDSCTYAAALADTDMTEKDIVNLFVAPFAEAGITTIDWCIFSTGFHNCRTRYHHGISADVQRRSHEQNPNAWGDSFETLVLKVARVYEHLNRQPKDVLEIIAAGCHDHGIRVFGNVRLNHALNAMWLNGVPGRAHANGCRRDFSDQRFHRYLLNIFEDLLQKGIDGISLDFERKAPFFPDEVPIKERTEAGTAFVQEARKLTSKPISVRVCYDAAIGEAQGQSPEAWISEGLVDIVAPATHNHEPDDLHWSFDRFLEARDRAQKPVLIAPQIWPTPRPWKERYDQLHPTEAVIDRCREFRNQGTDGVYFFNFCCFPEQEINDNYFSMFRAIRGDN